MIDERAVHAAKFWKSLSALHVHSKLSESEFEQFTLMVLGLTCVALSPGRWRDELTFRARESVEALRAEVRNRDDESLRRAWIGACDVLASLSPVANQAQTFQDFGSRQAFEGIIHLIDKFEEIWGSRRELLLDCFDEIFHRAVGRLTGTGYRSGDTAAALAAHLSARFDRISERFTTTGEFAILRCSALDLETATRVVVMLRLNFLLGLRLKLHGIEVDDVSGREDGLASLVSHRFLLIDHPLRIPTARRTDSLRWSDQQSSLQVLDQLLQSQSEIGVSLIIVPGADRTVGGWRNSVRQHLVRSGRLLAVIDLPQDHRERSRKSISAWLIGEESRSRNRVLMVDAKSVAGWGDRRAAGLQMELVAGIVSLGLQAEWPSPWGGRHRHFRGEDVEAVMNGYFRDGYRDLDGVCRHVTVQELAENSYKLAATDYLGNAKDKKRKILMPLLNSDPILEALRQGVDHGKRIYVIGNNGEGKSILLADLAERIFLEHGRRGVGVSFGLTDRFPFEPPKSDMQPFIYVGARTTERGIALGRTTAEVNRLVREIHVRADRLEVFNAVVKHLGFGERRYLVPAGLNNSLDDDRGRYAELQQLSEVAADNAHMLRQASVNRYELGLLRQDSSGSITTFGELSSGEQQLLILALKLTAYANDNTVILIDEPELSLHVSWQRAIPGMLEIVGSKTRCSMVVATHSPVVIASATHRDDKCFVARAHALTELGHRQRRSVETALFDGFRTYTANNRQVHERCAAIVSEAIQRLNADRQSQKADVPAESLNAELDLMDKIIREGGSPQTSYAQEDLDLVFRTRAALNELVALGRGNAA